MQTLGTPAVYLSHLPLRLSRTHLTIMAEVPAPTPISEWPDYSVTPTGGDVFTQDLNAPYDKGDLCWMLISACLCWYGTLHPEKAHTLTRSRLITPAIGFLYAGMHRRKAALTMIFQSLFCACACGIQFWIYGLVYSVFASV
jgi:Amt family ammonium transporter